jgi:fatty acid desaturase
LNSIAQDRSRIQHLLRPSPRIYWADLLLSAGAGWALFALSLACSGGSAFALLAIASFPLYRAYFFLHEICHQRRHPIRGFRLAWDLVCGMPLQLPSFTFYDAHQQHHQVSTYGTEKDPEYIPLAKNAWISILKYAASPLVVPIVLTFRFAIATPLSWVIPPFRKVLKTRYSSLAINRDFRRDADEKWPLFAETVTAAFMPAVALVYWAAGEPNGFFVFLGHWYTMTAMMMFVNQFRSVVSHRHRHGRYDPASSSQMRASGAGAGARKEAPWEKILADSSSITGGPFVELIAPLASRYHGLHHYFPDLPYHSLAPAHRILAESSPVYGRRPRASIGEALRSLGQAASSSA